MRETTLRIPLAIMFVMLTALSCRTGIKSSDTEAWRGLYEVEVNEILRIGSEDLANDPYVFSGINDLRIDATDNVYALDRKEFMIKVFSPTGKFIKTYELKKGQGPGEFQRPLGFDIGPKGDLFVTDSNSRRITAIDQAGRLVGEMTLRAIPELIAIDKDGSVYLTEESRDKSKYLVHKYHFPDGKVLA